MQLAKCTECGWLIDLDEIEELDGDEVIGCGLNEDDYMPCEDCPEKHIPADCHFLRRKHGFTKTPVSELTGIQ